MAFFLKEVSPLPIEYEPVLRLIHEDDLRSYIKDASVCTVPVPATLDWWVSYLTRAARPGLRLAPNDGIVTPTGYCQATAGHRSSWPECARDAKIYSGSTAGESCVNVSYDRPALPILHDCDLVVVGGSLGGMETALTLCRAGLRVALVEARTYLGREITATLRPWVPAPVGDGVFSLPPLITDCIEASGASAADGEFPLRMDAIKIRMEDRLLDAGVKLVYASRPVGVCVEDGVLRGLVIANKSGRQVITCNAILDASTTAIVARLAGAEFEASPQGPMTVARTIEFDGVEGLDKAVSQNPDVIVLDTLMPVMTGHEMLERLRRNPHTKDIPVIMCTARSDVQDIATASSYNISDYVTKPFNCTELIERIETALARKNPV